MAYEIPGQCITVPASTGLKQYRGVSLNASGYAVYPAAGAPILGVVQGPGTTGSTVEPQYVVVMLDGVSKMEFPGSTVSAGDLVSASSVGRARALSSGDYAIGRVVYGSSGSTGRILSVALAPVGTT